MGTLLFRGSIEERDRRIIQAAELLQQPPTSVEDLLEDLDNLKHLLSLVEQVPSASTRDVFRPAMEALVADGLLQHPDTDVKVSVACCMAEVVRITAPDPPYNDERMKDFFELAVLAFGKLSCIEDGSYLKAVSIIKVFAKYRSCVLLLDLQLDDLVVQMFQHFLSSVRPEHSFSVFKSIEETMVMILKESEEISLDILRILISSVKKENENVSPRSYMLGDRVLRRCASKLQPYLPGAMASLRISTDDYSGIVGLMLSNAIQSRMNAITLPQSSMRREIDPCVDGSLKSQLENPEKPPEKVACFHNVSPLMGETSKCLPDSDIKVAAANDTVLLFGPCAENSFKLPVNNDDSIELASDSAPEKVTPCSDQPSDYPREDDPKHKDNDGIPERDGSLGGSEHGDTLKQQKYTDSIANNDDFVALSPPFSNQPSELPGKNSPQYKEDDSVPATDALLKGSHGDAMNQQKNADASTYPRPENEKELGPGATQASNKRGWKPNLLKKPEEGYDHVWLSGERRFRWKEYGTYPKKRSRSSTKCGISNGLYSSPCVDKTPKRRRKVKNEKISEKDDAKFSSVSAIVTTTKIEPSLVASEMLAGVDASEKKHEKGHEKNVPTKFYDKRRRSSVEESAIEALNSISITKESNLAEISKEQRKRTSSSQEVLGSVAITKESNFAKTSKNQCKRKNSPSREEAFGSVSITKESNFAKTSKEQCKRRNSVPQEEVSACKALVGCRVRVWWPLDEMFYEGHIALFDSSEKKHMVIYDDGDREMLNLTSERWELVGDDNASDPIQETVPGQSDLTDMHLGCIIDSYSRRRSVKKKKVLNVDYDVSVQSPDAESKKIVCRKPKLYKALNVDDDVPVQTPGNESKNIICSKAESYKGEATGDMTPSSTLTKQHNLTPKIKVEGSESRIEGNPISWMAPRKASPGSSIEDDECSELVDVHGYKVKVSTAPILAAIFAKYGDIAVNCRYKSPSFRASLLELVSDVVKQLKNSDIGGNVSAIKAMKSVVSDAADAKLDVTWLQQYLDEFPDEEDTKKSPCYLMALRETTMRFTKAAKKDLIKRNREVLAAEKSLVKAERRLQEAQVRAGEAERSVKVFAILGKKIQQDIDDQKQYQLTRSNELL